MRHLREIDEAAMGRRRVAEHPQHRVHVDGGHSPDRTSLAVVIVVLICSWPRVAVAQSGETRFELGLQLTSANSSEFDQSEVGAGGRFSWHPAALFGIEAEIDHYAGDFPDTPPSSHGRTEGFFGVTGGPRFDRVRLFGRFRPGFMNFGEASQPFACLAIFPPPLPCILASGRTVFALDIGGGGEVFTPRKTFLRVDIGDRLLKYPGPALDNNHTAHEEAFFGNDFRFAIGGGLRF